MQQTDKYKLNLIERDDVFSPDALNGNVEKLEDALDAVRAEAAAGDAAQAQACAAGIAALDQRLQVFEAHKLVIGSAREDEKVYLDFTPKVLYVKGSSGSQVFFDGRVSGFGLSFVDGELKHDGYFAGISYIAFL